jgi:hypothetical protein
MNGEEHPDIPSASIYDKMDWRKVIQARLEDCLKSMGNMDFPKKVDALIACFAATYPGFDAKKQIADEMDYLKKKYKIIEQIWDIQNQTKPWWEKDIRHTEFLIRYKGEIFEKIRDLSGIKRMLLWGGLDSEAKDYGELQDR